VSTAGSSPNGAEQPQIPGQGVSGPDKSRRGKKRTRVLRWQGIIPILLALVLVLAGWLLFGEQIVRNTLAEAATKALGAQVDIGDLEIRTAATTIELRGVALADPFDRNKNLFEVARIVAELEPRPLLEKKVIVKRLGVVDVKTGTRRSTPARPVTGGGFAPRAMAEVQRFAKQFKVPLLSLTPIDTLKSLVLDPTQLKAVQAALALAQDADSAKQAIEQRYAALRIQETVDSSRALVARLQGTNVRTLGVDGTRRAVADVRQAVARVDSAKARVEGLLVETRRRVDSLQSGVEAIDVSRKEDYEFARGLLKLPSLSTPDIGAALFGDVTIDKFEKAVYWSTLARQYAPPGLLPRKSAGPERLRKSGTTVHFAEPRSYPRFLLQRAAINVDLSGGIAAGKYEMMIGALTSDPALVGLPTVFAMRSTTRSASLDSLRIGGSMNHTGAVPREIVNARAAGVKLPMLAVPSLPYSMDPGRGTSELRFVLDGTALVGQWSVRSTNLTWRVDSARARKLNTFETLVVRVLTGVRELELTADVSGTLEAPKLSVRSNLDRQVADRLRAVAGEEIAAAQAKVRAQVDRIVAEKAAPVKAKIADMRAEGERRVADARARLDQEKQKLDERLKALSGGLVGLPRLPGD
jgi:uncharacterized protein (TIGR03545 family)